jgi:hypothetical protein
MTDLYERAIARLPKWILVLGLLGTPVAGRYGAWPAAGGFLVGAAAGYFNFRLIERAVNKIARLASTQPVRARRAGGPLMFLQFAALIAGAVVILRYTGFNTVAALCGFLVCPAAVVLEILYELLTYGHS